jgi:hypothetical protein
MPLAFGGGAYGGGAPVRPEPVSIRVTVRDAAASSQ